MVGGGGLCGMLRTEMQRRLGRRRLLKVVLEFVIIMYSAALSERLSAKQTLVRNLDCSTRRICYISRIIPCGLPLIVVDKILPPSFTPLYLPAFW
jgi:hypothetical protein